MHAFVFFLSDAADASRLKAASIEDLHPHAYYKGHLKTSQVIIILMFKSLSRTVTCTRELSVLICVIPRGKDFIPPV